MSPMAPCVVPPMALPSSWTSPHLPSPSSSTFRYLPPPHTSSPAPRLLHTYHPTDRDAHRPFLVHHESVFLVRRLAPRLQRQRFWIIVLEHDASAAVPQNEGFPGRGVGGGHALELGDAGRLGGQQAVGAGGSEVGFPGRGLGGGDRSLNVGRRKGFARRTGRGLLEDLR